MNSSAPSQADSSAIKHLSKAAKQHRSMLPEPTEIAENFQQLLTAQFQQADTPTKITAPSKDVAPLLEDALNNKEPLPKATEDVVANTDNPAEIDPASLLQSLGFAQRLERSSTSQATADNTSKQAAGNSQPLQGIAQTALNDGAIHLAGTPNPSGMEVNVAPVGNSANPAGQPSVASQNQQAFSELLDSAKMADALLQTTPDNANTGGEHTLALDADTSNNSVQNIQVAQADNIINKPVQLTEKSVTPTQPPISSLPAIAEYPGKSGWDQAIGQRVLMMIQNTQQTATISLNPPELGPLDIVIQVNNEQADTTFLTDRQEVRQALEDGMDNLRNMMKESGISLGQTNVGERNQQSFNRTEFAPQRNAMINNLTQQNGITNQATQSAARVTLGAIDTFV